MKTKTIRPALGLMLYQLAILLFVTGGKLRNLVHWDAVWYRDIAVLGYDGTYPLKHDATGGSNLGFFPAFPLTVRGVIAVFHLPPDIAVAVAAQLACIGLWAYFILLLRRIGAGANVAAAALFFYLVQPGSFYNVIGYSEALFTASLLGYVYWAARFVEEPRRKAWHFALALAHGYVLSGTRIVGLALLSFPLILVCARALEERKLTPRPLLGALALGILSMGGLATFLIYCHYAWGHWDVYWDANRIGWRVYYDPWKLLHWSFYTDVFFFGNLPEVLGRLITVATLGTTIALTLWSWNRRSRDTFPLAINLLNLGLLFQTIVGSHGMHSMTRYLIPTHALTLIAAGIWLQDRIQAKPLTLKNWVAYGCTALFLFAIQIMYTIRYSHSDWIS